MPSSRASNRKPKTGKIRRSDIRGPPTGTLTYSHTTHMVFHMKTTLNIDDTVMAQLKRESARQKRTMSELVETALRNLFRAQKDVKKVPPLPTFHGGEMFVDPANRDELYRIMEGGDGPYRIKEQD
jgi:hypothetical protein